MTITDPTTHRFQGHVAAGAVDLWVDQRGTGPDVLLIAGLSDPAEAWSFQLDGLSDQHRLTAYDNRGAGRSPMIPEGFTVGEMADDAAGVLRALGIERAHVMGFSGGSATAQELALRHPELVRSLVLTSTWAGADALFRVMARSLLWLVEAAPSDRAMLEAFLAFIYTGRAHDEGLVDAIIEDAMAFEFAQEPEAFVRQLTTWMVHDTHDRLPSIAVPTLVVAGDQDVITPPRYGQVVADRIPGAELVVLEGEAHQPFQESPEAFNELVTAFWRRVDAARPA